MNIPPQYRTLKACGSAGAVSVSAIATANSVQLERWFLKRTVESRGRVPRCGGELVLQCKAMLTIEGLLPSASRPAPPSAD